MWSKYQVYPDFVPLLLLIVNLVFRFKFAAICSLCKIKREK